MKAEKSKAIQEDDDFIAPARRAFLRVALELKREKLKSFPRRAVARAKSK
jgi:hypothetical protein